MLRAIKQELENLAKQASKERVTYGHVTIDTLCKMLHARLAFQDASIARHGNGLFCGLASWNSYGQFNVRFANHQSKIQFLYDEGLLK